MNWRFGCFSKPFIFFHFLYEKGYSICKKYIKNALIFQIILTAS